MRAGVLALGAYAGCVVAANVLIKTVGTIELPNGTHLIPVGFGLMAPSGVLAAGGVLVARDAVQRTLGWRWALVAIVVGAALSALLDPALALASGLAFLAAEVCDQAVFTPLWRRSLALAVLVSGIVGAVVDSVLFVWLAVLPFEADLIAGLVIAKVYVSAAVAVVVMVRNAVLERRGAPGTVGTD